MERYDKIELVKNYLQDNAMGERNAVKSRHLEQLFNVGGEGIRNIINTLRTEGYPICSGYNGYWFAESVEEAEKTKKHLVNRMFGIKRAVKGLETYISNEKEKEIRAKYKQLSMEDFGVEFEK